MRTSGSVLSLDHHSRLRLMVSMLETWKAHLESWGSRKPQKMSNLCSLKWGWHLAAWEPSRKLARNQSGALLQTCSVRICIWIRFAPRWLAAYESFKKCCFNITPSFYHQGRWVCRRSGCEICYLQTQRRPRAFNFAFLFLLGHRCHTWLGGCFRHCFDCFSLGYIIS